MGTALSHNLRLPRPAGCIKGAWIRPHWILSWLIFGTCVAAGLLLMQGNGAFAVYGAILLPILTAKFALSMVRIPRWHARSLRVGVVVTMFNEDGEIVRRCLEALRNQTRKPDWIVVVDDASSDPGGRLTAGADPDVVLIAHQSNLGKREALATGFRALHGLVDVYACIDSDAVLEPDALERGALPFSSDDVMAVTGTVIPSNFDRNLLTRLIDIRYLNAFLVERGAYSALGSVLCVCGALAFYRADMVHRNLAGFLDQSFLGRRATVGDDRHLTNRALREGRVVLARDAIAHTAVPERLSHYVRQQARWGRSFFRESLWALWHLRPSTWAFWLTAVELLQWLAFTTMLAYVLVAVPLITGEVLVTEYLAWVALMSVARSARYFDLSRVGQSMRSRVATFACTPIFGLMNLLVMIPLRIWSLLTLRRTRWGTRDVVEVTA